MTTYPTVCTVYGPSMDLSLASLASLAADSLNSLAISLRLLLALLLLDWGCWGCTWKLPCLPCIGQCLDGLDCTLTTTLLLRSLNSLEAAEAWRIAKRLKFCSNSSASITINSSFFPKAKFDEKEGKNLSKHCRRTLHYLRKKNKRYEEVKSSQQLFELSECRVPTEL